MPNRVATLIVGAGHAGCNLACLLEKQAAATAKSSNYVVLERAAEPLHTWRSRRWKGFQLNTPGAFSRLHGQPADIPDNMLDRPIEDDLRSWDKHLKDMGVKVRCNTTVTSVTKDAAGGGFVTTAVDTNTGETTTFASNNVVVCSGSYNDVKVPQGLASKLPTTIKQHTPVGFDSANLGSGSLVIVGGGQSGYQIADIILNDWASDTKSDGDGKIDSAAAEAAADQQQRKVYICTSQAGGALRTARGKDLFEWLNMMGFLTIPTAALAGMPPEVAESMRYGHPPVTGPNKAISPFSCHRKGAVLLGYLKDIAGVGVPEGEGEAEAEGNNNDGAGPRLILKPNRGDNLSHMLAKYKAVANQVDGFINKWVEENGGEAATGVPLESDLPEPEWDNVPAELLEDPGPLELDLAGITDVLWATGYSFNLKFVLSCHNACLASHTCASVMQRRARREILACFPLTAQCVGFCPRLSPPSCSGFPIQPWAAFHVPFSVTMNAIDYRYLTEHIPEAAAEFDPRTGMPRHWESPSTPGLFFCGFPWLNCQQSQNLFGIDRDQALIVDRLRGDPVSDSKASTGEAAAASESQ